MRKRGYTIVALLICFLCVMLLVSCSKQVDGQIDSPVDSQVDGQIEKQIDNEIENNNNDNNDDKTEDLDKYSTVKGTAGLEYVLNKNNDGYVVSMGTACDSKLIIPPVYNGKKVKEIASCGFQHMDVVSEIFLPETLEIIHDDAFSVCSNLVSIYIPKEVLTITGIIAWDSPKAIFFCEAASNPDGWELDPFEWNSRRPVYWDVLPEDVIDYQNSLYVLNNNNQLTLALYLGKEKDLVIPEKVNGYTVTSIGKRAFWQATGLDTVEKPDSVTVIQSSAFAYSSIKSFSFYNVKTIESGAFYETNLENIVLPNTVVSVGEIAFSLCRSMKTCIINALKLTSMQGDVFELCEQLVIYCNASKARDTWDENWNYSNVPVYYGVNANEIIEQDNMQFVLIDGSYTLTKYCGADISLKIPDNIESTAVTKIGDGAFNHNYTLVDIYIPLSVTDMGKGVFGSTTLIAYCERTPTDKDWQINWDFGGYITDYWQINNENYFEQDGMKFVKTNGEWSLTSYTGKSTTLSVPSAINGEVVTSISKNALHECSRLTAVFVPNTINKIEKTAFYNKTKIYCETEQAGESWATDWNNNATITWNQTRLPI